MVLLLYLVPNSASPSNSVNVLVHFSLPGQVKVDDMVDLSDVDSSGCDVTCDKDGHPTGPEVTQSDFSLPLLPVSMDSRGL